jgi:1,4-alpha-glucan branching enzyme
VSDKRRRFFIDGDPWLEPFRAVVERREHYYGTVKYQLEQAGGLLQNISQGHHYYGITRGENNGENGWWYREWAPGAYALFMVGDFNGWNRQSHPMQRDDFGVWSIFLPDAEYKDRFTHESRYKVHVVSQTGAMDRIPAYARRVLQETDSPGYAARHWNPHPTHIFQHPSPAIPQGEGLRIYEAHVGMAQEEGKVGTYDEFTRNIIPRIKALGYNAIQLMGILEHPYYASFGYQVSSFYAPSSRFGTPDQLKTLIDTAHANGLIVLLDLVHSHAVKNTDEGLNLFDGTPHQYFHDGLRGIHSAWDSKLFDYSKTEVLRFLLSNVRYWLEDFRFDGFRFDGVTSMLYHHHGLGDDLFRVESYFGGDVDDESLVYLKLANEVAHTVNPQAITVAEDVSGMPGLARPIDEGGIGFDFRLSMGIPDFWFTLLEKKRDEDWGLGDIYNALLNRRRDEKHVAYVESHDQALVGDKTLAFWLMDKSMYSHMANDQQSYVIDRGMSLHKMIRLLTFALGGEGYLNFMGNEFGHPEWIDFPRAGNNDSYHHARRQWSLVDNGFLRYQKLNRFDQAMQRLDSCFHLLTDPLIEQLLLHEDTRQIVFRRGPLVFVANFHGDESYQGLRIPLPEASDYRIVLDTDREVFGGANRCDPETPYIWQDVPLYGRVQSAMIYLPSRSMQVLAPVRLEREMERYRETGRG